MANSSQARKRARQSEQRRVHNQTLRSALRTAIKRVRTATAGGDPEAAREAFRKAVPTIDSMVNKGILPKNTAARYKHRLNTRIKNLLST
ncbi:MAG: 30S ribosomal protein S20 [Gammaproteobacteria bacterium]